MSPLNAQRITFLDICMVALFSWLLLDFLEQPTSTEPHTQVVYAEEFGSDIKVRLTQATAGDSLYTFCAEFDGEAKNNCVRYIVFRNRDLFPDVLDSEDDFTLIEGEDYLIPVR